MSNAAIILLLISNFFFTVLNAQTYSLEKGEFKYGRTSYSPKGIVEINYLTNGELLVMFIDGISFEMRHHNDQLGIVNSFVFDWEKYCDDNGLAHYKYFFFNDSYYFIVRNKDTETKLSYKYFKIDCVNPSLDFELIDLWTIPHLDCRTCEKLDLTISPDKKKFALGHHNLSPESGQEADTRIYMYEAYVYDSVGNVIRSASIDLKKTRKAMPRRHFILDNAGNLYWATRKFDQFYFSHSFEESISNLDFFGSLHNKLPQLKSIISIHVTNYQGGIQLISMYSDDHRNETKGVLVSELLPKQKKIEFLEKIDYDQQIIDRLKQIKVRGLDLVSIAGQDKTPTMHKMDLMKPIETKESIFLITQFQHYTFSYNGATGIQKSLRKNADFVIFSLDHDFQLKQMYQIPFLSTIECSNFHCGRIYSTRIPRDHSLVQTDSGISLYMLNHRANYLMPVSKLARRHLVPSISDNLGYYKISLTDEDQMTTQLLDVWNNKEVFNVLFNTGAVNANGNLVYFSTKKKEYKLVELIEKK
ncbi:MAG: hypothetical protein CL840_12790 [Crocinitomicaceae bacterium]|nr:hypothetical protein [Crocinitomicaceae bacterium]|tara:strand:+ start:2482 stop:4071 length:1590 start_codon:yes stop_codon:yes gene_type:complete